MGVQTLAQLEQELQFSCGNRPDLDPAVPVKKEGIDRWLNRALRWAALPVRHRHPQLKKNDTIVLVDGTTRYALPADLWAIRFVVAEEDGFKYDPQLAVDFYDGKGGERTYARDGMDFLIQGDSGNAGKLVRVYYWARPVLFSTPESVSELDPYFDEVILMRAVGIAHAAFGDLDRADYFNNLAAELVNDYAQVEQFESEDTGWRNELIRGDSSAGMGRVR